MGILINPKGRSLLHPEPFGRGASGHSVLEKQHLSNKMIVFQDALILFHPPYTNIVSYCNTFLDILYNLLSEVINLSALLSNADAN